MSARGSKNKSRLENALNANGLPRPHAALSIERGSLPGLRKLRTSSVSGWTYSYADTEKIPRQPSFKNKRRGKKTQQRHQCVDSSWGDRLHSKCLSYLKVKGFIKFWFRKFFNKYQKGLKQSDRIIGHLKKYSFSFSKSSNKKCMAKPIQDCKAISLQLK